MSVWKSWYDAGSNILGYVCCHSAVHISYCTGEAGKAAAAVSSAQNLLRQRGKISTRHDSLHNEARLVLGTILYWDSFGAFLLIDDPYRVR
jgi:hypothetical protein